MCWPGGGRAGWHLIAFPHPHMAVPGTENCSLAGFSPGFLIGSGLKVISAPFITQLTGFQTIKFTVADRVAQLQYKNPVGLARSWDCRMSRLGNKLWPGKHSMVARIWKVVENVAEEFSA